MSYITRRTEGQADAPLVFTFHGTGGDENQFHGLAEQLLPEATVISPRGDVPEMGMNRYFRRKAEGLYDMEDLDRRTEAMAKFLRSEVEKSGAKRVIGLGYSNGANILAAAAFRYPKIVGELILMHPLIPWVPEPQPGLAGRRVLITAGQRDPICPAPQTQQLADWFTAQGTETVLDWHGGGHGIERSELQAVVDFLNR
ncbi:MAG: alpha/beta hydrolase [Rhodobacteraceae bacterium]|nr:alpha/beta hydrolase [Paracoccaceae bacterium]